MLASSCRSLWLVFSSSHILNDMPNYMTLYSCHGHAMPAFVNI